MVFFNPVILIMPGEKRIIQKFRKAGATRPPNALSPSDLGISQMFIFNRMVRKGLIQEASRGYYYLNENRETTLIKRRLDIIWAILMILAITVLIAFFWSMI